MTTANSPSRIPLVGALSLAIAACDPSPFELAETRTIGVEVPSELTARAIEDERLTLLASVDGRPLESVRGDGVRELVVTAVPNSDFELELEWCYRDIDELGEGCTLRLATLSRRVDVGESDLRIPIRFEEFRSDFDEDEDGSPNHVELREGFDPRNDNACPDCRTDIDLTIVRRAERPDIDGRYFNGSGDDRVDVWNEGQLDDRGGRLFIDTLLSGAGTNVGLSGREGDVEPPKWGAMHDGRDLFLFVLGEGVPKSRDTTLPAPGVLELVDDDAIEVYLDTPDRLLALKVPVLDVRRQSNINEDASLFLPDQDDVDSDFLDNFDFATCPCDGERDFYELRFSLAWLGVVPGDVIGIEVQLNDQDGEALEERWGWRARPGSGRLRVDALASGGLPGRALIE